MTENVFYFMFFCYVLVNLKSSSLTTFCKQENIKKHQVSKSTKITRFMNECTNDLILAYECLQSRNCMPIIVMLIMALQFHLAFLILNHYLNYQLMIHKGILKCFFKLSFYSKLLNDNTTLTWMNFCIRMVYVLGITTCRYQSSISWMVLFPY